MLDLKACLTTSEAARHLGVAERTLRLWVATGRVEAIETRLGYLYPPTVIERLRRELEQKKGGER